MAFKSLEEQREYMREWRARNPDYQKQHYAKNLERRRAGKRAEYWNNREDRLGRVTRYREENPEKVREQKRRYREQNRDKETARIKKWNEENPDRADIQNAKRILHEQTGLAIRDIPADLAAAKAEQVRIGRWVREQIAAQRIEARSDETPVEAVQPERREPGPKDAPNPIGDAPKGARTHE